LDDQNMSLGKSLLLVARSGLAFTTAVAHIRNLVAIAVLVTGGCATETGVLQMGKDTYTLSVGVAGTGSVSGNNTSAKRQALSEANQYCAKMGKQILVKNVSLNSTMAGSTSELIFQCLDEHDPELDLKPEYKNN
jgi:hypothetical protein